jgi:hypothetical protein
LWFAYDCPIVPFVQKSIISLLRLLASCQRAIGHICAGMFLDSVLFQWPRSLSLCFPPGLILLPLCSNIWGYCWLSQWEDEQFYIQCIQSRNTAKNLTVYRIASPEKNYLVQPPMFVNQQNQYCEKWLYFQKQSIDSI